MICALCHGTGTIQGLDLEAKAGESPAQKSARIRRNNRVIRDQADVARFVTMLRDGHNTEMARKALGFGDVRARRLRQIAVRCGMLAKNEINYRASPQESR